MDPEPESRGGRRPRTGRSGGRPLADHYVERKWLTAKMKTEDECRRERRTGDRSPASVPESAAAVFGNYVIVRKIFENFDWRELCRVRGVCGLWRRTAAALRGAGPARAQAFGLHAVAGPLQFRADPTGRLPPSLALTFANKKSFVSNFPCETLSRFGTTCNCDKEHKSEYRSRLLKIVIPSLPDSIISVADFIDVRMCHPAKALVVVNCDIPSPLSVPVNPLEPPNVCGERKF